MTPKFVGDCVGGPHDGMRMAHTSRTKQYFKPMVAFSHRPSDDEPVIPVVIGEYRLNDYGQWHWWETEAGKALDVLERMKR